MAVIVSHFAVEALLIFEVKAWVRESLKIFFFFEKYLSFLGQNQKSGIMSPGNTRHAFLNT